MFSYHNKVTGKLRYVALLPFPFLSCTKILLYSSLLIHFVTRSTSSVMSGANTLAAMWATSGNDASQWKQAFEESPNSGVESISAASTLSRTEKRDGLRPRQLLQGCPSSHLLGPSMIQQHPIEWILQLLILFLAMHFQSALLNALSSNSYSSVQDSYLLLILLLIGKNDKQLAGWIVSISIQ